ncbi:outer membrane beta-barrel protein [Endozoicomonas atrinae]|uniref:outer membrane beta-barrel protein n=1 Tax=Endozoicomonas atrinae TaxID=1333660 RepID=UPI000825ADD4|nr:outer membrane beta-barrel protein [Endozoicomonas atrinae]
MKKITSLLTALTVSAVSSVAMATGWEDDWSTSDIFVGLEGGYSKTKVKVDGVSGADKSDNTGFFGLRLGSYWEDEARAYFTVGYLKPKDANWSSNGNEVHVKDIKQLNLLVSADYLFMPEWEVQPFVGLTIGAAETKAKGFVSDASTTEGSFKKKWAFAYGAQAGVIYQIDNIDLEAGLKYLTNSTSHHYEHKHDVKLKVNDSRQVYVAASIHF